MVYCTRGSIQAVVLRFLRAGGCKHVATIIIIIIRAVAEKFDCLQAIIIILIRAVAEKRDCLQASMIIIVTAVAKKCEWLQASMCWRLGR